MRRSRCLMFFIGTHLCLCLKEIASVRIVHSFFSGNVLGRNECSDGTTVELENIQHRDSKTGSVLEAWSWLNRVTVLGAISQVPRVRERVFFLLI